MGSHPYVHVVLTVAFILQIGNPLFYLYSL